MAEKIIVVSGKGGVGKSSVSFGLASALVSMGKKVLLIDADMGFRSLDLIMNIGSQVVYNWVDVIENRCDVFQAIVKGEETPDLLSAPMEIAENIEKDKFAKLLESVDGAYDYIFADSSAGCDLFHIMLSSLCNRALAVVTCDPVCVRSADSAATKLLKNNPELDIKMVVNRFDKLEVEKGIQLKLDDVIDSAKLQLIGVIPEDDAVRLLSGGNKISKYAFNAFVRTAKRIEGENVLFNQKDFY